MNRVNCSKKMLTGLAFTISCQLACAVSPGTGDMTPDSSFPTAFVDNPTSGGSFDHAVAIVPSDSGGYWLLGGSDADDGTHATPVVAEYSSTGVAMPPAFFASNTNLSSLLTIISAVKGVNNGVTRIYFVGEYVAPNFTDSDFGVVCMVPTSGFQACPGFGTNGHTSVAFDRGGSNNDFPTSVTYDASSGGLYIAGNVDIGGRTAVGVARIDGTTGARDSNWGNNSTTDGTFVYPVTFKTNGSSYAKAITVGSPRFFAEDVFVVGNAEASGNATDRDGFILPIDAVDGANFDAGWNAGAPRRVYFDLGTTTKTDFLTAVTLRHNGQLLVAGLANGDSGLTHLILGEFDGEGVPKTNFCGGLGVCQGPLFNAPYPAAIAERPGEGDIVIAATNTDSGGHGIQGIYEIDSRGASVLGYDETSWTSNTGTTPSSFTNGVLVDSADRVIEVGSRLWDSSTVDYDMTIRRWTAKDTIFGNSFGGPFVD